MYDLVIVGGGPAGLTAAAYAINKRIKMLLVSEDLGGKINYRLNLKGMEGHEVITGSDVVEKFKRQLEYLNFAHATDRVTQLKPEGSGYSIVTQSNKRHQAQAVIVATGATPRGLRVPGEKQLVGKGVSYSAISHAQLYIDREPAIVGSNRRALYAAAEMAEIARQVHLILPEKGELDSSIGRKLQAHPKVKIYQSPVKEVRGSESIESVVIGDETIKVDGLFVELGPTPASKLVADLGIVDGGGRIMVDNKCATKLPGLFAAGDVTDVVIEQVLVAIGEGAKAALSAYEYLLDQEAVNSKQ